MNNLVSFQLTIDNVQLFSEENRQYNKQLILCAVKLRHSWRRYKAETATPFLNLLENNYLLFFLFFV